MNSESQKVTFRLVEIKELYSFKNSLEYLKISDFSSGQIIIKRGTKTDYVSEKYIDCYLDIKFAYKSDEKKIIDLFGIQTLTRFELENHENIVNLSEDDTLNVPNNLLISFFQIAYSSTRGLMLSLTANSDYSGIYLPLIDSKELLKVLNSQEEE